MKIPRTCLYCIRVFPGEPGDNFCCPEHKRAHDKKLLEMQPPKPAKTKAERPVKVQSMPSTRAANVSKPTAKIDRPKRARKPKVDKPKVEVHLRPIFNCATCGKPFKAKDDKSKYCCKECYTESQKKQVECVCEHCEGKFFAPPSYVKRGQGRYCSRECRITANYKVEKTCPECNKPFFVLRSRAATRICCSQACKGKRRARARWATT